MVNTVSCAVSGIFVPKTIRSLEHSFPWWNFRSRDHSFLGTFVPWTVRSLELSFSRLFVPWTVRSMELSFPGTWTEPYNGNIILRIVLAVDRRSGIRTFRSSAFSLLGAKVPTENFRSWEQKFPGTFAPGSESSRELSFQGTKVPGNFRSRVSKFAF